MFKGAQRILVILAVMLLSCNLPDVTVQKLDGNCLCLPGHLKQSMALGDIAAMKRVLIVDDSVDAVDTLAMLLQSAGHEVRTAVSGAEALRLVTTFQPDVVLLDLRLPDMDGHTVARELRARPESARCVLAALTGFDDPEHRRKTQEAGFDFHLVKPVGLKDLTALLGS